MKDNIPGLHCSSHVGALEVRATVYTLLLFLIIILVCFLGRTMQSLSEQDFLISVVLLQDHNPTVRPNNHKLQDLASIGFGAKDVKFSVADTEEDVRRKIYE